MTDYTPPERYTPAALRLAQSPNAEQSYAAELRKQAQREELLYDTVDYAARKVNRWKVDLLDASKNRAMREVLPIAEKAYAAEIEYALWQMVVQASGPTMREPLEALSDTVRWAREQVLDAVEDRAEDLTDARIYARWARKAHDEFLK